MATFNPLLVGPSVMMVASRSCTSARARTRGSWAASRTLHSSRMRLSGCPEMWYSPADRSMRIRPFWEKVRSRESLARSPWSVSASGTATSVAPTIAAATALRMGRPPPEMAYLKTNETMIGFNLFRMKRARRLLPVLAIGLLVGCRARDVSPVIVQGAMDVEVRKLAGALADVREEHVQGWTFWRGTVDGYPVIVSKTLKGMAAAAAATAIGAE